MTFGRRGVTQLQATAPVYANPAAIDDFYKEQASERARYERELNAQVSLINTRLPAGCAVVPFALIPASVWVGANGQFLMKDCCFYPAHPLNNILLPIDEQTSQTLSLPIHPNAEAPALRENCNRLIGELRAANPNEKERLHKVVSLALHIGRSLLGDVAYEQHSFLFGVGLGLGQRA